MEKTAKYKELRAKASELHVVYYLAEFLELLIDGELFVPDKDSGGDTILKQALIDTPGTFFGKIARGLGKDGLKGEPADGKDQDCLHGDEESLNPELFPEYFPTKTTAKPANDPWKNRSAGMKCRTCTMYVVKQSLSESKTLGAELGRCRRNAPTMKGFPVVFPDDWCGDHKLDEAKI